MQQKRRIEVFSAGCAACRAGIELAEKLAGLTHEVVVHDMQHIHVAQRAESLGIRSVPAILVDGKLAACCSGHGPDEATVRAAILGQPYQTP